MKLTLEFDVNIRFFDVFLVANYIVMIKGLKKNSKLTHSLGMKPHST